MDSITKSEMDLILSTIGYDGVFVKIEIQSCENGDPFTCIDWIITRMHIDKLENYMENLKTKLSMTNHIIPFTKHRIIYYAMQPQLATTLEDLYNKDELVSGIIDVVAINAQDDINNEQNWKAINFLQQFRDKFYNDTFLPGYYWKLNIE